MKFKYFVFYRQAYGNDHHRQEFDNEKDVLELVKKAADEDSDSGYRELLVIYGQKLEFEPCTIVESYRIKAADEID